MVRGKRCPVLQGARPNPSHESLEQFPTTEQSSVVVLGRRRLTATEFQGLAEVPAAAECFVNLDNPRTCRTYQGDIQDICSYLGWGYRVRLKNADIITHDAEVRKLIWLDAYRLST